MTCLDKLKQANPDWDDARIGYAIKHQCPWNYRYIEMPDWCEGYNDLKCKTCWNLDSPDKKGYPALYPNLEVDIGCTIKDSGDRTQFETGAVRDMREGKGRCDLMPLEVVAGIYKHFMSEEDLNASRTFADIANFIAFGSTDYLYMALDESDVFSGWETMLLEVAKHFEEGAKKYGENNWQKGIPVHCYIDSAVRHYLKWLRGDKDEPHDRAFVWNLMCCIWEVDYHKEHEDA